jgi:uncharacterized repeat protein (TIGR03803 family)
MRVNQFPLEDSMRPHAALRMGNTIAESLESRRLLASINILSALNSSQIQGPRTLIEDTSGNLFFLANNGTTSPDAGLYELPAGSNSPTLLVTFPKQSGDVGALAFDIEGDIVGIANTGGANSEGFVWEFKTGASSINTLASFNTSTSGSAPQLGANLVSDSTGDLFGTAQSGGANNGGTVWELAKDSGTITTLASFQQSVSNNTPNGIAIDSGGNLFGTIGRDISVSGAHGSVWELPKGASTINVLAAFNGTNGDSPNSPLYLDPSGNVFGEANAGGTGGTGIGDGVVFEIPAGSNAITDLASFTGANGSGPKNGVIADSSGNLFGTTQSGGSGQGVVFELPKGASTITALGTFDFTTTGTGPNVLLLDPNGSLIGAAAGGGSGGGGTIFKITPGSGGGGGGGSGGASSLAGTLTGKQPSSVIAGQKTSFNPLLTLTNSSASTVAGTTTFKLFLSTGTTVDSSSVQLASIIRPLKLKPHAHVAFPFKVSSLPASVQNDTYHLVVEFVDPAGNTVDIPSSATTQVAPAQIDLTGQFSKTPVPGRGGKTSLTFTVSNDGNTPASGPLTFNVETALTAQPEETTLVTTMTRKITLKNGKSQKFTVVVTLSSGTFFIFIELDPANAFNDINTDNNIFATSAAVTVG